MSKHSILFLLTIHFLICGELHAQSTESSFSKLEKDFKHPPESAKPWVFWYWMHAAISKKAITGIIIKPNQIGTVMEALAVVEMARQEGLKIIVSHRSAETNDDFIADFLPTCSWAI